MLIEVDNLIIYLTFSEIVETFNNKSKFYGHAQSKHYACVELLTLEICKRLLINPGLAFGEGYMSGEIRPVNC